MSLRVLLLLAFVPVGCAKPSHTLPPTVGESTVGRPPAAASARSESPAQGADDPCEQPPMVAFEPTSRELGAAEDEEIARLARCLSAPSNESLGVVLVGYTDVMGTVPANLELGLARSQAVMRRLIDAGVAPGRIVVASAGELQRPSSRWGQKAHRVEVLLARGGPVRPNEAPVARGIDADGLIRRGPATTTTSAPASPAVRPTTPATSPARPTARPR